MIQKLTAYVCERKSWVSAGGSDLRLQAQRVIYATSIEQAEKKLNEMYPSGGWAVVGVAE